MNIITAARLSVACSMKYYKSNNIIIILYPCTLNCCMAPIFSESPPTTTFQRLPTEFTMASPNSRIAASHRTNAHVQDSSVLHQPRTIYVGKDQYPINLTPLVDVSSATWKNQRGFDQLESAVLSLQTTHEVADLLELVHQEMVINVDSAAQDAANKMKRVLASVTDV